MKTFYPTTLLLLAIYFTASADNQPPKEVFDYLKPLLQHETTTAGDIWTDSGNGGYVFRFDLDVTGDGRPEMFLSSSLNFRNESGLWQVYENRGEQGYIPFEYVPGKSDVGLFATELWIEDVNGQRSILAFGRDRMDWFIGRYSFRDGRVIYESAKTTQEMVERTKAAGNVKRVVPEVRGVLLADLLRNPEAEWKRINFDSRAPNPNGYYIAAEDAEKVKGLSNFTPGLALKWLQSAAVGKRPAEALGTTPAPSPEAAARARGVSSTVTPAQRPAPSVESKAPAWPWIIGLAVLAAIGLLIRKRRT
jgi:MYXO-CTERM domain-containing protein